MNASSRLHLRFGASAVLLALTMLWPGHGRAQGDTAKPNPQPQTQNGKPLSEVAPKAILVDPCKAKNPPSYCGKR